MEMKELNLKELRLVLQGLNQIDTSITIDPMVDEEGWKLEWQKKDDVQVLANKIYIEILKLEELESDWPFKFGMIRH